MPYIVEWHTARIIAYGAIVDHSIPQAVYKRRCDVVSALNEPHEGGKLTKRIKKEWAKVTIGPVAARG